MRRTRLRTTLLLAVLVAVGGIGILVSRSIKARRTNQRSELGQDFLPLVAQRIQNFRRIKLKRGKSVWQMTAKDAQFYEKRNEIVLREPEMTFFLEGGNRQTHVSGREGHLTVDGHELRSVTLIGKVSVQLDDLTMETEEATYDHVHDLITAPGPVTVRGRQLDLRGHGMEIEVGPQHVRLLRDVHTIVRSDAARS
jgi:LPS export ABC transporter protein LptC